MSEAVQELLRSFDRLPESERRQAVTEILRRTRDVCSDDPDERESNLSSEEDEDLVRLAELTFLELDAREAADGKP